MIDWSPVLAANAKPGREDAVLTRLRGANPHLAVYRKDQLPARWHYGQHPRVPSIIGVAEDGWTITTHSILNAARANWNTVVAGQTIGNMAQSLLNAARAISNRGDHGYDSAAPSMRGIFVVHGPAFARSKVVPAVENIHIYGLLCDVLGLKPAPNDGNLEATRAMRVMR